MTRCKYLNHEKGKNKSGFRRSHLLFAKFLNFRVKSQELYLFILRNPACEIWLSHISKQTFFKVIFHYVNYFFLMCFIFVRKKGKKIQKRRNRSSFFFLLRDARLT